MDSKRPSWLPRYGVALLSVVIAVLLTHWLWPGGDPGLSPLFLAAVVFSAWYGGIGPGLLTTVLAGLSSAAYIAWYDRSISVQFQLDDALRTVVFCSLAILINWLHLKTRRTNEELRVARDEAEAANRAKDRFLAILSHELRNPLNPVLLAVSQCEDELPAGEALRDDMHMIRRNVELEARLIDDLLDSARIRNGKLTVNRRPTDVHVVLRDAIRTCQNAADQKQVAVELHDEASSSSVHGDPARLQQVFWNLLNNAAKFSPQGGRVIVRTANDAARRLRVEVRDEGMGIEPQILPRIFEPFEQGAPDVTEKFGGMGLGLAISRALVLAHDGDLSAASEGRNKGTTFTVTLPLADRPLPNDKADRDTPKRQSEIGNRQLRILLVEDHEDTLRLMGRLLQRMGHRISGAGSVAEALRAAEADGVDLVISDLGLPDGSGLDLMRQLRSRYGLKGIALSGFGMDADIRMSADAGFIEHLTKPIDLQTLNAVIQRVAQ